LLALVFSLIAASVMHRFIEVPAILFGKKISRRIFHGV
jgi:peptidoglycan/LPS O-acetylase OafA/YrhL